jgi:hypothetical protein
MKTTCLESAGRSETDFIQKESFITTRKATLTLSRQAHTFSMWTHSSNQRVLMQITFDLLA